MLLSDDLEKLPNIGAKRKALLNKLGIFTILNLIEYFPVNYEDRSNIKPISMLQKGEIAGVRAVVFSKGMPQYTGKGLSKSRIRVCDSTGNALYIKFYNQTATVKFLNIGSEYLFFGKIDDNKVEMLNPSITKIDDRCEISKIVPRYRLVQGLTQKFMSSAISKAMEECLCQIKDVLPCEISEKYKLMNLHNCIKLMHNPRSAEDIRQAKRRILYEKFLLVSLAISQLRQKRLNEPGIKFDYTDISNFISKLPYTPTNGQLNAINDIISDVSKGKRMNRLIQGDVGCGKTTVAAAAMYITVKNGYQAAIMAPTEILARQHFESLSKLFGNAGVKVSLLCGKSKKSERTRTLEEISSGNANIIVGTHALLTNDVVFKNLAMIITDEQHRFGVNQRSALAGKGMTPHVIVMSATPIPRTLSLILYGELDISTISEVPPGRQEIDTFLVNSSLHKRMYAFIEKLISEGRQGYIVCPAIDENDAAGIASATAYAERLVNDEFPNIRIAMLHGKMKNSQKEEIMSGFADGNIKILVSTTVIEVGIDVPNAVFMVIENAERFGLSTLHQLRGRVGRGKNKSYCILVSDIKNNASLQRLKKFAKTNDGFEIAEIDLKERGPGDFLGNRQHGLPLNDISVLSSDIRILECAKNDAERIVSDKDSLEKNKALYQKSAMLFDTTLDEKINTMN